MKQHIFSLHLFSCVFQNAHSGHVLFHNIILYLHSLRLTYIYSKPIEWISKTGQKRSTQCFKDK